MSNKEFYFIVAAADSREGALERTIEGFRGFTDCCLDNPIERGVLKAAGVWQKGEVKATRYMQMAYDMGKNS